MSDFSDLFDDSNLGKRIWSQFGDKQIKSAEKQKKKSYFFTNSATWKQRFLETLFTVKEKMIHWLIQKIGIRLTFNETYLQDNFKSPLY